MESVKYLGFDVHQSTISVAVVNADGKLVMQSVIATHAATILDFIHELRVTLYLTFEEGTHSAWLYDLLARRVARVVVCNPRQNALLKAGNKSDTSDARGVIDRAGTDAAPLPQQTSVLGLLRAGLGDAQQRRLPLRGRTTGARQETGVHPRTQPQPQSRSEKPV